MNISKFKLLYDNISALGLANKILRNSDILSYVLDSTNFMLPETKVIERAYCIVNDIVTTPTCCCGNILKYSNGKNGYRKFCSLHCANHFDMSNRIKQRKQIEKQINLDFQFEINVDSFDQMYFCYFFKNFMLRIDGSVNRNLLIPRNFINKFDQLTFDKVMSDYFQHYSDISFNNYAYNMINFADATYIHQCKNCRNPTSFVNFNVGYLDCCSTKCSNSYIDKVNIIRDKLLNPTIEVVINKNNKMQKRRLSILDKQESALKLKFNIIERSDFQSNETRYKLQCLACDHITECTYVDSRCYRCNPITYNKEYEILSLFNSGDALVNKRSVLDYKRLQLDIYSEKFKLAIEYNGLRWHSCDNTVDDKLIKLNHLEKTLACNDKNITLLHIFENEWQQPKSQLIWKSIINNKINKSVKIFARKCNIVYPNKKIVTDFLNTNHLQGFCNYSDAVGLEYNNELISIMTVGRSRFNKNYDLELLRFCSKINTQIIGGASKLFNQIINKYRGQTIISYANRRISTGSVYKILGFVELSPSPPNYFYVQGLKLHNRLEFQKHKLYNKLQYFDPKLSESENMFKNGYRKIWDCGNLVFVRKL